MLKLQKVAMLLAFILISSYAANAINPFRIGVIGGMNINKEYRIFDDSEKTLGFHVGGVFEYNFKSHIFISASTLLIRKGGKYDYSTTFEEQLYYQIYKKENYYLEIPIHFGYKLLINNNLSLFGSIGPYLGVGLFGKYKAIKGDFENRNDNIYSDKDHKRFDMGIGAKFTIEMFKHYQISVAYNYGLLKTVKDISDKNRNIMISAAYLFQLK